MKSWKTIDSRIVLEDPFMVVKKDRVQILDNKEIGMIYIDSPDAVVIIPVTKEKKLVTIKQYRYVVDKHGFEFPAGIVDKNEIPEQTAKRELEEETGYVADELIKLGEVYEAYSQVNRKMHIFLARVSEMGEQKLDNSHDGFEEIEVQLKTMDEISSDLINKTTSSIFHSAMFFLKEKIKKGEIEL